METESTTIHCLIIAPDKKRYFSVLSANGLRAPYCLHLVDELGFAGVPEDVPVLLTLDYCDHPVSLEMYERALDVGHSIVVLNEDDEMGGQ